MHATHHGSTPDPQPGPAVGGAADQIVGILTDPTRFRANIAAQLATDPQPPPVPGNDPAPATSRRCDGAPETDADRRFIDLRQSGYTGWIDQDGNPQTDA